MKSEDELEGMDEYQRVLTRLHYRIKELYERRQGCGSKLYKELDRLIEVNLFMFKQVTGEEWGER